MMKYELWKNNLCPSYIQIDLSSGFSVKVDTQINKQTNQIGNVVVFLKEMTILSIT